eukprot:5582692-Prymnesium_polylepis.2
MSSGAHGGLRRHSSGASASRLTSHAATRDYFTLLSEQPRYPRATPLGARTSRLCTGLAH